MWLLAAEYWGLSPVCVVDDPVVGASRGLTPVFAGAVAWLAKTGVSPLGRCRRSGSRPTTGGDRPQRIPGQQLAGTDPSGSPANNWRGQTPADPRPTTGGDRPRRIPGQQLAGTDPNGYPANNWRRQTPADPGPTTGVHRPRLILSEEQEHRRLLVELRPTIRGQRAFPLRRRLRADRFRRQADVGRHADQRSALAGRHQRL